MECYLCLGLGNPNKIKISISFIQEAHSEMRNLEIEHNVVFDLAGIKQ